MQSYITSQKDTDALIMEAADDRTLLSMIQSNRALLKLGEEAFRKRMMSNYPILARQKSYFERWSSYYLRTIFFLSKLKEEFDIDYIPVPSFNPEALYRGLLGLSQPKKNKNEYLAPMIAELGDEERIKQFFNSGKSTDKIVLLSNLLRYGNIPLFEELNFGRPISSIDAGIFLYTYNAARSKTPNIIDYTRRILDIAIRIYIIPDSVILSYLAAGAAAEGSIETLNYVTNLFPNESIDVITLLGAAGRNGQTEFIKYFLVDENTKTLLEDIPEIILDMYNEPIFLTAEKEKEVLNLLLDFYFSRGGTKSKFLFMFDKDDFLNMVKMFEKQKPEISDLLKKRFEK